MQAVLDFISTFFNWAYTVWYRYIELGGIYAKITIALIIIYPMFRRIISQLLSRSRTGY